MGPQSAAATTSTTAPLEDWLRRRDLSRCGEPQAAGAVLHDLVGSGDLAQVPPPGGGATRDRWTALSILGRADLSVARLVEGHLDALAILAEIEGRPDAPGVWGVWAANPPSASLRAARTPGGWSLSGEKPWCSGAVACTHALVTCVADDGYRLFAVELDRAHATPVEGTWPAVGMSGSDSRTVRFSEAPARAVGGPDAYLDRPGFWWGGVGVAAVWHGGAAGVADALVNANERRPLDDHALAHLGAVDAALVAGRAVLGRAADAIDAEPDLVGPAAEALARRVRAVVERSATEVLERVGRALGAAPLALDVRHSRRVADLTVYLRQSHAERDLVAAGRAALEAGVSW